MPFIGGYFIYIGVYLLTGDNKLGCWFLLAGLLLSFAMWIKYGEYNFRNYVPIGPHKVGHKAFKTIKSEVECSAFFPTESGFGWGEHGIPFLTYGNDNLIGLKNAWTSFTKKEKVGKLIKLICGPSISTLIPIPDNASPKFDSM